MGYVKLSAPPTIGNVTQNTGQFSTVGVGAAAVTSALYVNASNRIGAWVTGTNISSGADADGIFVDCSFAPSANVGNAASIGLYPTFNPGGGVTITTGYGLYVASGTQGGAGAVTTGYGLFVTHPTFGTTNYAAQIDNLRIDLNSITATNSNGTVSVLSDGTGAANFGTNATAHTTTLGSTTTTATTAVQSGSGGITVSTSSNGTIGINSGTGTIGLSTDATNTTVNLATGAGAKITTVGSTNGASSLTLNAGSAGIITPSLTGILTGNGASKITATTVTQYDVLVGAASNGITSVAPSATSGVPLISQGAAADPAFGTAVVAGGGTGATSFNTNGVVISNTTGTGALAALSLTNGQIVVGSTGGAPAAATITGGTGITVTNASNSITIASSGSSFPWSNASTITQSCAVNNGYFANNSTIVMMNLPATAALGDEIKFSNTSGGFIVAPSTGQTVNFLSTSVTSPQNLQSTQAFAAMDLVCSQANTQWNVVNNEGTFTTGGAFPFIANTGTDYISLISTNGTVWNAGAGTLGQLGNNNQIGINSPVAVVGGFSFSQIASDQSSGFGINGANGSLWSWGRNTFGQLGNNTQTDTSSPVSVVGGISFSKIAGGSSTSAYGLRGSDGTAWAWGNGTSGALGNQTVSSFSSPISVVGGFSFSQISAGSNVAYGLRASDGSVWAWGAGPGLGNNTTTNVSSPVSVVGGFSFIQISAQSTGCYALNGADGSVWAWGNAVGGALGNNTTTNTSSPVSVVGGFSFTQISSTFENGYGLTSTGALWAWGVGAGLGNNTTTNVSSPVSVVGNFSFNKLATASCTSAAKSAMAAWTSNGKLWAWGFNTSGGLGIGTNSAVSSPVLVLNTPI